MNYTDFLIAKPTLHSWNKPHLIMVYDPFNMLFNLVYWYFIEDIYMYVNQGYCSVLFL